MWGIPGKSQWRRFTAVNWVADSTKVKALLGQRQSPQDPIARVDLAQEPWKATV